MYMVAMQQPMQQAAVHLHAASTYIQLLSIDRRFRTWTPNWPLILLAYHGGIMANYCT